MPIRTNKKTGLWTSAVLTALIALVGGAISGFLTAYVQLSETKEKYSIQRAQEFQKLMDRLESKNTSRLAVLNLWQLYPEERDRKIIIAAAFAVGQPDLVELISGIDEELTPVADMLQARAHSKDTRESNAALRTLVRIDPVRGANVIIEQINEGISLSGDGIRHPMQNEIDSVFELIELAKQNETVVEMIHSNADNNGNLPVLYDYILYQANQRSDFITRLTNAYSVRSDLTTFNDYLIKANFFQEDALVVVTKVAEFVSEELKQGSKYRFEVQNALVGLRNNDLKEALKTALNVNFISLLRVTVSDSNVDDLTRARAFALLRKISPSDAIKAVAKTLAAEERPRELIETIVDQLEGLLIQLERTDPQFRRPAHCMGEASNDCIADHTAWAEWLPE